MPAGIETIRLRQSKKSEKAATAMRGAAAALYPVEGEMDQGLRQVFSCSCGNGFA